MQENIKKASSLASIGNQIQGKIKKLLKERDNIVEIMYKGRYAKEKCISETIGVPQESMLGLVGQLLLLLTNDMPDWL